MFEFNYIEEKDRMLTTEKDSEFITNEYIRKLSECSIESLHALDIIYIYNKLMVITNMTPKNRSTFEEERIAKLTYGLDILKRRIKKYYSHHIEDLEEIKTFIERLKSTELSNKESAYNLLQEYQYDLKDLYQRNLGTVKIVLPVHNLESINQAVYRENQYLNEIVDAVFAIGSYSGLLKYTARANSGSMIVQDSEVYFPKNPFDLDKSTSEKIKLTKPVSIYEADINYFEPVIDFYLSDNEEVRLRFNHEWIARIDKVPCREYITDYIPREFFSDRKVTVQDNNQVYNMSEVVSTKFSK